MDKDYLKNISDFEQAGAHFANLAGLLYTYHKSLCVAGFKRDEAISLVGELQNKLFEQSYKSGQSPKDDSDLDDE